MAEQNVPVLEVGRPNREVRRRHGKTDVADAIAAAPGAVAPHRRAPGAVTRATAPELIATHGVGPDTACTLLLSAGDNRHRLASQSSWAALLGSNPIPASSGKTHRHRLNRGGDRQANAALRRIAVVRMRSHPDTRANIDKKSKEGKSKPEAIRYLKRYIARELYAKLPPRALA